MTHPDITDDAVSQALAPLARALAADDYRLTCVRPADHHVLITVDAGPSACADCLVPKDLTERMALRHLRPLAPTAGWTVEIRYPADDPTETAP
ncbi:MULTISPECIES: hypothetical protein [unclassified Embleya]|uniref:hypothetical protein n=1 Tax=unclassified Embleya TaxID=2699296 RepID=UPI0033F8EBC7